MAPPRNIFDDKIPVLLEELNATDQEVAEIVASLAEVQENPTSRAVVPLELNKNRFVLQSGRFYVVYRVQRDGLLEAIQVGLRK